MGGVGGFRCITEFSLAEAEAVTIERLIRFGLSTRTFKKEFDNVPDQGHVVLQLLRGVLFNFLWLPLNVLRKQVFKFFNIVFQ